MVDKKITQLNEATVLDGEDLFAVVTGVATLPETKKTKLSTFFNRLISGGVVPDFGGWISIPVQPSYVSPTSIVFTGYDYASYFPIGTKIKFNQGATTKSFYVLTSVYSGGNTTLTLTAGIDFSVANSVITLFYYSHGLAYGFPSGFNWTPTWTGLTLTGSVTHVGAFTIIGRMLFWTAIIVPASGTHASSAGSTYINNPPVNGLDSNFTHSAIASPGAHTGIGNMWQNKMYTSSWVANSNYMMLQGNYVLS